MKTSTIYAFGHDKVISDFVSSPISFTKSLTDQSYYIVNSESVKLGETNGSVTSGAFDNAQVTDDLVDLRRPGLDRAEAVVLYENLQNDVKDTCDNVIASAMKSESAKADAMNNNIQNIVNSALANQSSDSHQ